MTSTGKALVVPEAPFLSRSHQPDAHLLSRPGPRVSRFPFAFELILTGGRIQHFGTDGADSLEAWTSAVGKVSTVSLSPSAPSCPLLFLQPLPPLPLRAKVH